MTTALAAPPTFRVRQLGRHEAADAVDAVFARLSPRSRYLRFHSPTPRLTTGVRARLADLDGWARAAVVAEVRGPTGWEPVGIARIAGGNGHRADLAVAVVDAWHRCGLGRRLLTAVAELATGLGYRELRGTVLPENRAMLGLARRVFPMARRVRVDDTIDVVVPLGDAALILTHEDLLADLLWR